MPVFEYEGLTPQGQTRKGTIEAENLKAAKQKLKSQGIFATRIQDRTRKAAQSPRGKTQTTVGIFKNRVSLGDLSLVIRQLATLLKANIPLVDSLQAVIDQTDHPRLKVILADVKNQVVEGSSLHKALNRYPDVFDDIDRTLVEAGELSGSLDVILLRLAEFKESQHMLMSRVKGALTYPVLMLVVTLALLVFLFVYVIPKILVVFESFPELELPWVTRVVMGISEILIYQGWLLALLLVIAVITLNRWIQTPAGRLQWDHFRLTMPIFGTMNQMVAISRFARTLATLLQGGVPMLQAFQVTQAVVGNTIIQKAIEQASQNIKEGESIAGPLKKSGWFPPLVIHMIQIGERTGELENMLVRIADAYDFQVRHKLETLTGLLGPVVLIVMGLAIGVIVFAVLVPMFELTNLGG